MSQATPLETNFLGRTMSKSTYQADELVNWLARIFEATGVAQPFAHTVSQALIDADLDGLPSHGVMQAPIYLKRLIAGSVSTGSTAELVHESAAIAVYDAGVILGALAADQAMADAVSRAKKFGISAVSVRRGFHFGAAGRYVSTAAEQGVIGIAMCNSRAMMPAPGGAEAVVGNNPLAIGMPASSGSPVVLDMAMSQTSIGRIRVAAARGEQLEDGWALDADGNPTNDPAAALKGMLTPIAGAKGFGLALMIDMLSSLLSSGAGGKDITSFYDNIAEPAHCSYLFIAIDPCHFGLDFDLAAAVQDRVSSVKASTRRAGVDRIRVPGEGKAERRLASQGQVTISDGLVGDLSVIAQSLGVAPLSAKSR